MLDRPAPVLRPHHRQPVYLLLRRLRLSQLAGARLLGISGESMHRYARGHRDAPDPVRIALYLIDKHGEKPAELYRELQVKGIV